jgi:hypothetical protein
MRIVARACADAPLLSRTTYVSVSATEPPSYCPGSLYVKICPPEPMLSTPLKLVPMVTYDAMYLPAPASFASTSRSTRKPELPGVTVWEKESSAASKAGRLSFATYAGASQCRCQSMQVPVNAGASQCRCQSMQVPVNAGAGQCRCQSMQVPVNAGASQCRQGSSSSSSQQAVQCISRQGKMTTSSWRFNN